MRVIGSEANAKPGVATNPDEMPLVLALAQAAALKEAEEKHEEQTKTLRELMKRSMRGAKSVEGTKKSNR